MNGLLLLDISTTYRLIVKTMMETIVPRIAGGRPAHSKPPTRRKENPTWKNLLSRGYHFDVAGGRQAQAPLVSHSTSGHLRMKLKRQKPTMRLPSEYSA